MKNLGSDLSFAVELDRFALICAGPALMAVRSKVLPLNASFLSPLPGFKSWPGM